MLHRCVLCFGALCLSPCLPSRAVSVRVACSLRCALHVASPHVACSALHVASLHVSSTLVASAHCMHVASFHRYIGNAQPSLWRTAVWRVVRRAVRARLDWAKAGLLRSPSGGAMPSCAGHRRRALHGQGHRAVRRRGDIRHRSKGACGASAAMRSWGGCRRTVCDGRLQWAWPRRPVRRATAAWCAWTMAP
jgi:hypothetical protein